MDRAKCAENAKCVRSSYWVYIFLAVFLSLIYIYICMLCVPFFRLLFHFVAFYGFDSYSRRFKSQHTKQFCMPTAILCYRKHDKTCYYNTKYPKYTAPLYCTHSAHITRENSKGHWYNWIPSTKQSVRVSAYKNTHTHKHTLHSTKHWRPTITENIIITLSTHKFYKKKKKIQQKQQLSLTHTHHCSFMALQYIAPRMRFEVFGRCSVRAQHAFVISCHISPSHNLCSNKSSVFKHHKRAQQLHLVV